jgi:hypothetical protein
MLEETIYVSRQHILSQYCSDDLIEKNGMGGACSMYGERRSVHRVLVWNSEGKRPLGRPRLQWDDNIKCYIQVVKIES